MKMTITEAIKMICSIVIEYVESEDYEELRKAEDIAYEYDIFMEFDDEYIAVEDDVFYLNR